MLNICACLILCLPFGCVNVADWLNTPLPLKTLTHIRRYAPEENKINRAFISFLCSPLIGVEAAPEFVQCPKKVPVRHPGRTCHGANPPSEVYGRATQGWGCATWSVPREDPPKGEWGVKVFLLNFSPFATLPGHRRLCVPRVRALGEEGRGPESGCPVREYTTNGAALAVHPEP